MEIELLKTIDALLAVDLESLVDGAEGAIWSRPTRWKGMAETARCDWSRGRWAAGMRR